MLHTYSSCTASACVLHDPHGSFIPSIYEPHGFASELWAVQDLHRKSFTSFPFFGGLSYKSLYRTAHSPICLKSATGAAAADEMTVAQTASQIFLMRCPAGHPMAAKVAREVLDKFRRGTSASGNGHKGPQGLSYFHRCSCKIRLNVII